MENKRLDRINELARKAKNSKLTEEEKKEQNFLRQEYIEEFKASLRAQLHSLKVIDEEGNDITPQKIKEAKKNKQ